MRLASEGANLSLVDVSKDGLDATVQAVRDVAPEMASVVAFLLSDDASYVNATVIPIDGGQSAKY